MNPTPPPAPTNGVAVLMAEIERIAQELRAYNKRPSPATEDQVKALVQLAERDRPLTLHVNSEAVAQQLVGKVEQQAKVFQDTGYKLINYLDDRQKAMTSALDERLAALKAAEASLEATAQRIPREVAVNWLGQWQLTAGFVLGPLLLVLLMLWFTGMFARVPQERLAAAQEQVALFQQGRAALAQELPEAAHRYFPYPSDPKPGPASAAPPTKKKGRR